MVEHYSKIILATIVHKNYNDDILLLRQVLWKDALEEQPLFFRLKNDSDEKSTCSSHHLSGHKSDSYRFDKSPVHN